MHNFFEIIIISQIFKILSPQISFYSCSIHTSFIFKKLFYRGSLLKAGVLKLVSKSSRIFSFWKARISILWDNKFKNIYRQANANVDFDKNMLLLKNPQFVADFSNWAGGQPALHSFCIRDQFQPRGLLDLFLHVLP